ncbi:MAG: glucose-6-phosphate isomerase [Candidatus Dojkabacteria bacterium]
MKLNLANFAKFIDIDANRAKPELSSDTGFINILTNERETEKLALSVEKAQERFLEYENLVVIGIGGSDLGARAIFSALMHSYHNQKKEKKFYFAGDTTDPEVISELLEILDLTSTLFLIVSKSGNTIEQASNFLIFKQKVEAELGKDRIAKQFMFITDGKEGTLSEISETQGILALEHPEVGGRFSVLSSVGMVPAALFGLEYKKLRQGAIELHAELSESDPKEDFAWQYALYQFHAFYQGKNINVLMPYQYKLRDFALWYRQLWAESLGKKENRSGAVVHTGATPVAAMGPTDQHSQLQLYNEGPNDKTITFIYAQESNKEIELPKDYTGYEQYEFFSGKSMQQILIDEMETTAYALRENGRASSKIAITKLDEYSLGQLFYFFELVTAYMGELFEIDAYNQPGVELSKNAMYGILGKDGYEQEREKFLASTGEGFA